MLPTGFLSCRSESLVLCGRTEAVRSSPALISFLMCCHSAGFFCARSYLYGAVSYRDAFDERRQRTFCLSMVPARRLLYGGPNAATNAIGCAQHYSRSREAVILV